MSAATGWHRRRWERACKKHQTHEDMKPCHHGVIKTCATAASGLRSVIRRPQRVSQTSRRHCPVASDHPVHNMVDELIVQPLRVAKYPFLTKPQSFGDRPTLVVPHRTPDLNSIQMRLREGMIRQRARRRGYQAASLVDLAHPVANGSETIPPIDLVVTHDSGDFPIQTERQLRPVVL